MSARLALVSLLVSHISVTDKTSIDLLWIRSESAGAFIVPYIVPIWRPWVGPGSHLHHHRPKAIKVQDKIEDFALNLKGPITCYCSKCGELAVCLNLLTQINKWKCASCKEWYGVVYCDACTELRINPGSPWKPVGKRLLLVGVILTFLMGMHRPRLPVV